MDDPDDIVWGTVAGFNLTRHATPLGAVAGVDSIIVRLADGAEVTATLDLPPPKHSFMIRTCQVGSRVRLKLGSVIEPIRIIEVQDSA